MPNQSRVANLKIDLIVASKIFRVSRFNAQILMGQVAPKFPAWAKVPAIAGQDNILVGSASNARFIRKNLRTENESRAFSEELLVQIAHPIVERLQSLGDQR